MKQQFENRRFRPKSLEIIQEVNAVLNRYFAQGYTMTLRQVYYQLVAADIIPNTTLSYDNLGALITDARRAGLVDWAMMEDRTRNIAQRSAWENTEDFSDNFDYWFHHERWKGQETLIEVWVEKEALAGVIQRAANKYFCPWMACRGYMADIELYAAANRLLRRYRQQRQRTLILHFGDHDPSGIDMTRDNADRLRYFGCGSAVMEVRRVALNMDQVQEYNPPPNPAKVTDSRFRDYSLNYGNESWELDALQPAVISDLIDQAWKETVDHAKWKEAVLLGKAGKEQMKTISEKWSDIEEFIGTQRMFLPDGKRPEASIEVFASGEEGDEVTLALESEEEEEDDE